MWEQDRVRLHRNKITQNFALLSYHNQLNMAQTFGGMGSVSVGRLPRLN